MVSAKRNCDYQEVAEEIFPEEDNILTSISDDPSIFREDTTQGTFNEGMTNEANVMKNPVLSDYKVVDSGNLEFETPKDSILVVQTSDLDSLTSYIPEAPKEPEVDPRLLDNSSNEIEIDEDLTLSFSGQGLGKRKVLKQPNILILSDEDGDVVINICVSRGGRVINATFNERTSTLHRKSLVSLAIRKAKDFWFEKSDLKEQCGELRFKITGS